jgi:16S rRNA (cytosine967-C5)-methyltransferase
MLAVQRAALRESALRLVKMSSLPLSDLLAHVADLVQGVRKGRSLTDLLVQLPGAARPGAQALAFDVLRRLGSAEAARKHLAPKTPPPAADALLLCALALLWPQATPAYTAFTVVNEAVSAAKRQVGASAGFVNAVLRRFLRERDALVPHIEKEPVARWNHPAWWIDRLRTDWPDAYTALLEQANQRPPMTLRVNARQSTAEAYAQALADAGRAATVLGPHSLVLAEPCPVSALPGFAQGQVSVQDFTAQRAAPLLIGAGLPPRARVLDACAAPGGKTAHLLELADLDVLALDSDAQRLQRVQETLDRLHLRATLKAGDARRPADWWDGQPFEAILLDAPCSASGIVRRHPDIRWLRRATDIDALARTQAQLLDALWPLLAPGGRLLFATCSVFKAEGQAQIDAFLQRTAAPGGQLDVNSPGHVLPLPDNSLNQEPRQERQPPEQPSEHMADGFFYALLRKPLSHPLQR